MDVLTWISNRIIVCSLIDQTASSLSSLTEEEQTKQVLELSKELKRRVACVDALTLPAGEGSPTLLTGKVNQLELILRQLQYDLRKEQEDKAMLQEQVQHLRQDNLRLHEESQTAATQLRRFTELFLNTMDKKPWAEVVHNFPLLCFVNYMTQG